MKLEKKIQRKDSHPKKTISEAKTLSEQVIEKLKNRGYVLLVQKKLQEAIGLCNIAHEIDPNNAEIFHLKGQIYLADFQKNQQSIELAVINSDKAAILEPHNYLFNLQYLKASSFAIDIFRMYKVFSEEEIEKMQNHIFLNYEKATAKFPDKEELHILMAGFYLEQKNYVKAEESFEKIIKRFPHNAIASFYLNKLQNIKMSVKP